MTSQHEQERWAYGNAEMGGMVDIIAVMDRNAKVKNKIP